MSNSQSPTYISSVPSLTMAPAGTNLATAPVGTVAYNPTTRTTQMVTGNGTLTTINAGSGVSQVNTAISMSMNGTTTFRTSDNRSVTVDEIADFIETMKKRLLILVPALEKHEHYPALKAAYEQYLLVERMCLGDDPQEE